MDSPLYKWIKDSNLEWILAEARPKAVKKTLGINHNVDELLVGILTQLRLKRQKAAQERTRTNKVNTFST